MRRNHLVALLLVVFLSIVSTVFVFLTLKTDRWAAQAYFFAVNGANDGLNQSASNHLFTIHRSPFYRCGVPTVYVNKTFSVPDCARYKPYGNMKTSCRSPQEMGVQRNAPGKAKGLFGSATECQQVHVAGNLQIAACVFITLALVLALLISAISLQGHSSDAHSRDGSNTPKAKEGRRIDFIRYRSSLVLVLLLFLYSGVILQVGTQIFGILAFTIGATPNANDANTFQRVKAKANFVAHSWVLDRGLTSYATVAWTTALAGAFITNSIFRTPR